MLEFPIYVVKDLDLIVWEVSEHWDSVILSQEVNLTFVVREKGHGV